MVEAYIQHSLVFQDDAGHPYSVGPIAVDSNGGETFKKSLHERYSGLNGFELRFARAIDKTQRVWTRNPSGSGYSIPLLHAGKAYFPDFLVWIDKDIVAIDTKGTHLLLEASASKLFEIGGSEAGRRIVLRLVSEGHVEISNGTIHTRKTAGFTVWVWRHGRPQPIFCDTEKEAAEISIRLD